MGIIKNIFNFLNGNHVRIIGFVLSLGLGSWLLDGHARVAYLLCVALAAVNWKFPVLGRLKGFDDFADPKFWPTFVLLGIAIESVVPGWNLKLAVGTVLTILDGMYFLQNY